MCALSFSGLCTVGIFFLVNGLFSARTEMHKLLLVSAPNYNVAAKRSRKRNVTVPSWLLPSSPSQIQRFQLGPDFTIQPISTELDRPG
jgi:hypothetical protein